MDTIKVEICTGTTCYVMGAGDILELNDHIDEHMAQNIEIFGSNCMDLCKEGQYGKAPFVKVNNTLVSEATVLKVVEEIHRQMT